MWLFDTLMHTQLIVLFALAVAVQSTIANASTSAYSRSSLWRPRHDIGSGQEHDVADNIEVLDGYAIHRIHQRKLNQNQRLVFCPMCRLDGGTITHTYRTGFCRRGGSRFACVRKKDAKSTTFFAIVPPVIFDPAALNPLEPNRTSMSTASASQTEEILIVAEVSDNSTSTVLPAVGCFSDADCELSARGLAAVNGSTPISRGGVVTGECLGNQLDDGVPGTCMCLYRMNSVGNGTARSATASADQAGARSGQQSRPTAQAFQATEADTPVLDICVRRASFETVCLFANSSGSAILINNTADGKVKLDVVLVEIEVDVPDDYEYDPTADTIVNGIISTALTTPVPQAEMGGDEYESVHDTDGANSVSRPAGNVADGRGNIVTPDPATPRGMPHASVPPPAPIRQVASRASAPTQAPTPTPVSKPRKRVIVVKVNKDASKSIFVKEIDVSMRVRD